MAAASLTGAAASGGAMFAVAAISSIFAGFSPVNLLDATIASLAFAFVTFLAAFASAAAIGVPTFIALENAKYRKAWPYFALALLVESAVVTLGLGRFPTFDEPILLAYFLPGLLIAGLFIRRMRPHWRAAERAESEFALRLIH